jgi:hypothetical protein
MTDQPQQPAPHWEAQIDALLDGELGASELAQLEAAAAGDPALAQALADARQLRQLLGAAPKRTAPPTLRRKLLAVGRSQSPWGHWPWLRRGAALACISLVLVVANLGGPEEPSEEDIMRGRRELALALSYVNEASQKANMEIGRNINKAMLDPVTQGTFQVLSQQPNLVKEYLL